MLTKQSTTQLLSALHFIVDAIVQLCNVQSVRAAHGVKYFGKASEVKRSILMWWQHDVEQYHLFEANQAGELSTKNIVGDDWRQAKYLQFLSTTAEIDLSQAVEELQEIDSTSDVSGSGDADASGRTEASDPDRLSTIEEETDYLAAVDTGTPGVGSSGYDCPPWCDADMWDALERQQQCFLQTYTRKMRL